MKKKNKLLVYAFIILFGSTVYPYPNDSDQSCQPISFITSYNEEWVSYLFELSYTKRESEVLFNNVQFGLSFYQFNLFVSLPFVITVEPNEKIIPGNLYITSQWFYNLNLIKKFYIRISAGLSFLVPTSTTENSIIYPTTPSGSFSPYLYIGLLPRLSFSLNVWIFFLKGYLSGGIILYQNDKYGSNLEYGVSMGMELWDKILLFLELSGYSNLINADVIYQLEDEKILSMILATALKLVYGFDITLWFKIPMIIIPNSYEIDKSIGFRISWHYNY